MFHHPKRAENNFKIVVDGSPSSPKSELIAGLFQGFRPDYQGQLAELPSPMEQLVMCDFLMGAGFTMAGHAARLWMFSLPAWHVAEKREIARGYDAAMLVAEGDDDTQAVVEAWEKSLRTLPPGDSFGDAAPRGLVLQSHTPADEDELWARLRDLDGPPPVLVQRIDADGHGALEALKGLVKELRQQHGP